MNDVTETTADASGTATGTAGDVAPGSAGTLPTWAVLRPAWRTIAAVALVAVVFAAPLRTLFQYQGPPMEEGFMLVFPERVLAGDVPHKDFLHLYGPGSLWALAGWYKIVGVSLTAERLFGLVQLIGIVGAVMALARPWGRRAMAASGILGTLLTTTAIGLTALAWNGAVALAATAAWLALRARRWLTDAPGTDGADAARRADRLLLAAGACAGVALLFRPDIIVGVTLSTLGALVGLEWPRLRRWAIGAFVPLLGYFVLFFQAGFGTAMNGMLIEPVFKLRDGRTLPSPPSATKLEGALQAVAALRPAGWDLPALSTPKQLFLWFFLLPVVVFGTIGVAWWRLRKEPGAWRLRVLLTVGLLGLGMMPQALQRPDSTHLAWVSCVPLAFLPATLTELFRHLRLPTVDRPPLRRFAGTAAAVASLLVPLLLVPHFTSRTYLDLVNQTRKGDAFGEPITRNGRTYVLGDGDLAPVAQRMLDDLSREITPGERLLVGPVDMRKTPYSDAYLYYLLPELTPATRYIEMDPGMANTEDSGLAEEVATADWLILSHVWDVWSEPNGSRDFGSDKPNQVVAEQFCEVNRYSKTDAEGRDVPTPSFIVYRKCTP